MSACAPEVVPRTIAGGFVLVSVAALVTAWRACQARPLGIGDFRTWLACHELAGRRCVLDDDRAPSYGFAELAKLLDVTEKRARASVKRLEAAGLIVWSDSAIDLDPRDDLAEGLDDTIGRGRGSVAIPRRMLRFLANGARPALIAVALAVLLRCLSRRKGGFDGRGRLKVSWVVRVFEVSVRQVKAARRELVELGWIEPEDSDQWTENRWGRAYRIDLGWSIPATSIESGNPSMSSDAPCIAPTLTPLPPDPGASSAPPDLHREPSLPGGSKNQEPGRGPTGFQSVGQGKEDKRPPAHTNPVPAGIKLLVAPTLADVRLEDLKDTGPLLDLHEQAVAKRLITTSEADRLRFVGAAEHSIAVAKHNPPGLFAWLVRGGCWRYITQDDEDRARRRLKLHDHGPPRVSVEPTAFSPSRPIEPGGLSDDARTVKAIREASIKAGLYRDPFPAFQARYPEWDRVRWDVALVELGLG